MASSTSNFYTRISAPHDRVQAFMTSVAGRMRLTPPRAIRSRAPSLGAMRLIPDERPGQPAACRAELTLDSRNPGDPEVRAGAWILARLRDDLQRHAAADLPPSRIAVSGVSGLIGGATAPFFAAWGHRVDRLVRRGAAPTPCAACGGEIPWQPGGGGGAGEVDLNALEGVDAIIHLAGSPIGARVSKERLREVRESRVEGTRTIARAVAALSRRPRVLVVASGTGFYGDRGEDESTEDAGVGSGPFAEVARDWEAAAEPARQAGVRVVHLRIGMVISPEGGAVGAMLPTFRLGLGCIIGRGTQWWSWIGLDDCVGVILRAVRDESMFGPLNVVSSSAVRAADFAAALARACDRPLFGHVPPWALRWTLGESAEVAMASTRVAPERLRLAGHRFLHPSLDTALRWEMGLSSPEELSVWVED